MEGRTLLGALVRLIGFGTALFELVQLVVQLVQLASIGIVVMKQPQAADAAGAAVQQALMPGLLALILFLIGVILLRQGDKVADWAYSPRKGRSPAPAATTTAAKPAAAKRPPAKTTTSDS